MSVLIRAIIVMLTIVRTYSYNISVGVAKKKKYAKLQKAHDRSLRIIVEFKYIYGR